jgi:pyruvate/2-oxoglutarate dehydrogenase complex dihydrolipoamide dehydrogenase (E3) component
MAKDYDFIVLGSGNAGSAAAWVAKEAGKSVAIMESWDVGGTCALRGCVPKKIYVAAAETLDAIARPSEHHIAVGPPPQSIGRRCWSASRALFGMIRRLSKKVLSPMATT